MNHRRVLIGAAVIVCAALPFACGDSSGTGGAGTGTTTVSSGSTTHGVTVTAQSSSTGAVTCDTSKFSGTCAMCLQDSCCTELADADAMMALTQPLVMCMQASCTMCLPDPLPSSPECTVPASAPSAGSCVTLGNGIDCNPVTNEGCTGGAACDTSAWGFSCYGSGNDHAICETCGANNSFCQVGLTCANASTGATCYRYCCSNADCGGGTCVTNVIWFAPELGLCSGPGSSTTSSSSTGTGGGGGAGGGGSTSSSSSSSATGSGGMGGAGGSSSASTGASTGAGT